MQSIKYVFDFASEIEDVHNLMMKAMSMGCVLCAMSDGDLYYPFKRYPITRSEFRSLISNSIESQRVSKKPYLPCRGLNVIESISYGVFYSYYNIDNIDYKYNTLLKKLTRGNYMGECFTNFPESIDDVYSEGAIEWLCTNDLYLELDMPIRSIVSKIEGVVNLLPDNPVIDLDFDMYHTTLTYKGTIEDFRYKELKEFTSR